MAVQIPNKNQGFCVSCGVGISVQPTRKHAKCVNCLRNEEAKKFQEKNIKELRLRLFEAELEDDPSFGHKGFYVILLAWDLEQAKAFAQKRFNEEYEGVIDVYEDPVNFSEIEGPFEAGTIITSLHY